MKCSNCGRERNPDGGSTLKLSEEERTAVETMTGEPAPAEFFYCTPCYRVVTDREMGARLISSQLEIRLRLGGHPRAKEAAEAFYKLLINKTKSKQVS